MLGPPALAVLMQLSVTMAIKKGGDFIKLPSDAGYLSSQSGRRAGDRDVKGPACSPGHRLGKMKLEAT